MQTILAALQAYPLLAIFLVAPLFFALWHTQRTHTLREHVVGEQRLSTLVLAGSLMATVLSSHVLFEILDLLYIYNQYFHVYLNAILQLISPSTAGHPASP